MKGVWKICLAQLENDIQMIQPRPIWGGGKGMRWVWVHLPFESEDPLFVLVSLSIAPLLKASTFFWFFFWGVGLVNWRSTPPFGSEDPPPPPPILHPLSKKLYGPAVCLTIPIKYNTGCEILPWNVCNSWTGFEGFTWSDTWWSWCRLGWQIPGQQTSRRSYWNHRVIWGPLILAGLEDKQLVKINIIYSKHGHCSGLYSELIWNRLKNKISIIRFSYFPVFPHHVYSTVLMFNHCAPVHYKFQ